MCKRFRNLLQRPPKLKLQTSEIEFTEKITLCRPMRKFTIGLRLAIEILKKVLIKNTLS